MEVRLPIPKNWQDFEMICHKLWKDIWSSPNAQRNGRQGQPQAGVDIFGMAVYLTDGYAGVQCKDRDSQLGQKLTVRELEAECMKATSFVPSLQEFTMATTAPREKDVQERARVLTQQMSFGFPVNVWSWEDIEEEIRCRPLLINAYFTGVVYAPPELTRVSLSVLSQTQQCAAFFSRPEIGRRIPRGLKRYLVPLIYELSENAFRHGGATRFDIVCEDSAIHFEDDGIEFNPLSGLDPTKTTLRGHVGSMVLKVFLEKNKGNIVPIYSRSYSRIASAPRDKNRLSFQFSTPTWKVAIPSSAHVSIDLATACNRSTAAQAAASLPIPSGQKEVTLVINGMSSVSAMLEFFDCLLRRLGTDVRLIAYVPMAIEYLSVIAEWFPPEKLLLLPR